MIKRQGYRSSFESAVSREPPPGLPAVHSRPTSVSASDKMFSTSERDRERGFKGPFSENERIMVDALFTQDAHTPDAGSPLDGDPGDSSLSLNSFDDDGASKRKKKKRKVKNAEVRLPCFGCEACGCAAEDRERRSRPVSRCFE